jgi:glycine/D-amino acid oxidase-like deaminating enzyme/nitrite reductase/ring-hydroxylating ferredoxin subunit
MDADDSPSGEPTGRHESVWIDDSPQTAYDRLESDRRVEVAVVGGGIAGVTTAAKLAADGYSVALLERDRVLNGVTGHTTAKVTSLHGLVYDHLVDRFGTARAREYAAANEAAIDDIEATVERRDIDCGFARTPAYTYLRPGEDRSDVRREVEAARQLDLPVSYVRDSDLPYDIGAAVKFDEQARFHPRQYLLELVHGIDEGGGDIFERTTVKEVDDGAPCRVATDGGTVRADSVVVATNFPVSDDALYFARLSPKRSYVVAARLEGETPEGMYYYPREPYFSVRPHAGEESLVLLGGQNHRTGEGNSTEQRYQDLERQAREHFDVASIECRWSTQDFVSVDHVPFVGSAGPQVDHVYVATGFGGWGMTNATAAAMVLRDRIAGHENPWQRVFRPTRFEFGASKSDLLSHNGHTMKHLFGAYLENRPSLDLSRLDRGEARIYDDRDDPVAAYRDETGEVHSVSAVCPHMGCLVEWNDGEHSWDCPCHGSRFDLDGSVLDAPAVDGLEALDVGDEPDTPATRSPSGNR